MERTFALLMEDTMLGQIDLWEQERDDAFTPQDEPEEQPKPEEEKQEEPPQQPVEES